MFFDFSFSTTFSHLLIHISLRLYCNLFRTKRVISRADFSEISHEVKRLIKQDGTMPLVKSKKQNSDVISQDQQGSDLKCSMLILCVSLRCSNKVRLHLVIISFWSSFRIELICGLLCMHEKRWLWSSSL